MMEYAPADGKMGVTLLLKNLPFHKFLWSEKKIPVILEFILCVYKIPVGRTKKAIGTGGKKRLIIIENVRNPNKNRTTIFGVKGHTFLVMI